jgi:hypothetical protein
LSGTWRIEQPSGWTDFRFTLTQAACKRVFVNDPCSFAITGNGAITPAVCSIPGLSVLSKGGAGYPCSVVFPVTGNLVADTVTLNFGQYSDGASVDFTGRVAVDRSAIGDLSFRDASGVSHHIGGGCAAGPVCLDTPGQLHFIRGGTDGGFSVRFPGGALTQRNSRKSSSRRTDSTDSPETGIGQLQ